MHIKVVGEIDTSHGISDNAKRPGRDHHWHNRQTIQPVGKVHRVGRSDNHDDRERHEQNTKVHKRIFKHRQRQLVLQLDRVILRGPVARDACDQETQQKPHFARHAVRILLAHFGMIVRIADGRKTHGYEQHQPDKRIVQPRPKQGRCQQRANDQQPAHRWCAGLGEMPFGAIVANGLALALLAPQHRDQRFAKQEPENKRREKRPACAEGDIAKQVKEIAAIRQQRQPIEHISRPNSSCWG